MRAMLRLIATVLAVVGLLFSPLVALADDGEGGGIPQPDQGATPELGQNPEAERKAYLALLFQEINVRRDRVASPRYVYMTDRGNEAINLYLHDLLPEMVEEHSCFHGSDHEGSRAGWDYLGDIGVGTDRVGGEVLACPDTAHGGFWTPPGIADGWWDSPHHFHTLYADVRPDGLACGAEGPLEDKLAYETVACITVIITR